MKKLIPLILSFMLIGCASKESTVDSLNTMMKSLNWSQEISSVANNKRNLFSYYLPTNIGKRNNDITTATFISNNVVFYMNLDIGTIINNRYYNVLNTKKISSKYKEITSVGTSFYSKEGELEDYNKTYQKYRITVNEVKDDYYLVYVEYNNVNFASVCRLSELENLIYDIFAVARSVQVKEDDVVALYSNKINIVLEDNFDIFNNKYPESGVLADLISKDKNTDEVFDEEASQDEYDDYEESYDEELIEDEE